MTSVDFISPKHSPFVTISNASVDLDIKGFEAEVTGADVALTVTGAAYSIGKLTTLTLHPLVGFMGTKSVLSFNISGTDIPLPSTTHYTVALNNSYDPGEQSYTDTTGYVLIDQTGTVTIGRANLEDGYKFPDSYTATSYATTIKYTSA